VATDLETDFLGSEAPAHPALRVLHHDITAEDLPSGFDRCTPDGWWSGSG
jgi:hypothetical protein